MKEKNENYKILKKGLTDGESIIKTNKRKKFIIVLTNKGHVYSWGNNEKGQCGLPSPLKNILDPTQINFDKIIEESDKIIDISTGLNHTLALSKKGKIYSWGENLYGECGSNENCPINEPAQCYFEEKIIQIGTGKNHSVVLTSEGEVYAWGTNHQGQCGSAINNLKHLLPKKIKVDDQIIQIQSGLDHTLILSEMGIVHGWGYNINGQCDPEINPNILYEPTHVQFENPIIELTSFDNQSAALTYQNELFTWGKIHPKTQKTKKEITEYPVHHAIKYGFETIASKLLNEKAANVKDKEGNTLLHIACEHRRIDFFHQILRYHNVDINAINEKGKTPLYKALVHGFFESLDILLKRKAYVNEDMIIDLSKSRHCDKDILYLLLQYQVDLNVKDNRGKTPLYNLMKDGNFSVCPLLINQLQHHIHDIIDHQSYLHLIITSKKRVYSEFN